MEWYIVPAQQQWNLYPIGRDPQNQLIYPQSVYDPQREDWRAKYERIQSPNDEIISHGTCVLALVRPHVASLGEPINV